MQKGPPFKREVLSFCISICISCISKMSNYPDYYWVYLSKLFIVGKSRTSLIAGLSVRSIVSLSMP